MDFFISAKRLEKDPELASKVQTFLKEQKTEKNLSQAAFIHGEPSMGGNIEVILYTEKDDEFLQACEKVDFFANKANNNIKGVSLPEVDGENSKFFEELNSYFSSGFHNVDWFTKDM